MIMKDFERLEAVESAGLSNMHQLLQLGRLLGLCVPMKSSTALTTYKAEGGILGEIGGSCELLGVNT